MPLLFPLSCRSARGLRERAARLAEWTESGTGRRAALADIGYTLARRRSHLPRRAVVLAHDHAGLAARLRLLAAGAGGEGVITAPEAPRTSPDVVFVFSGYGSQWDRMGAGLAGEPAFRAVLDELAPVFEAEGRATPYELLTSTPLGEADASDVQPALFAMQTALAALWRHYGVRPAAVLGQSMGELAAAVASGGLPLTDAARVVLRRSEVMRRRMFGLGTTAVVELPVPEVRRRLAAGFDLEIAVHSSTRATVVAGDEQVMDAFLAACEADDIATYPVRGGHAAGHSRFADRVVPELTELLAGITGTAPEVPFYSTVLSDPRAVPAFDGAYWAANVRRPVRFLDALTAATGDGLRTFVEVSPHPVAVRSLADTLADTQVPGAVAWGTLRRGEPALPAFLAALARVYCRGASADWSRLHPAGALLDLPTTPWDHRERRPVPGPAVTAVTAAPSAASAHPLLGTGFRLPGEPGRHVWQTTLDASRPPWLADHRLGELPLLPGTGYAEMALAAACAAFGAKPPDIEVTGLAFHRMLPLGAPVTVTTTLTVTGAAEATMEISGRHGETDTVHASAAVAVVTAVSREPGAPGGLGGPAAPGDRIAALADKAAAPGVLGDSAVTRADRTGAWGDSAAGDAALPGDPTGAPGDPGATRPGDIYPLLRAAGLHHGPAFAGLAALYPDGQLTVSRVRRPEALRPDPRMHCHPALLDAALHGVALALVRDSARLCLPASIGRLRILGDLDDHLLCRARVLADRQGCVAQIAVYDGEGALVAELGDVVFRRFDEDALPATADGLLFTVEEEDAPLEAGTRGAAAPAEDVPSGATSPGTWLIRGGDEEFRTELSSLLTRAGRTAPPLDPAAPRPAGPKEPVLGIVHLGWGPGAPADPCPRGAPADGAPPADTGPAARLMALVGLATAVSEDPQGRTPRLYVVTRGTRTPGDAEPDLAQAGLTGLTRSLRAERPRLRPTLIDLGPGTGAAELARELCAGPADDEVVWRDGVRRLVRLTPLPAGRTAPPPRPPVRPGGGYVVTGGTGGLGLATAHWLAGHGAGCVVLNGRSLPGPGTAREIESIRATGTGVVVVLGDIAEPGVAEALMRAVTDVGAELRGVVHAAGVLDDALVTELDRERIDRVWSAKATGAWRLHLATPADGVDWWIGYSSSAALLGSPGQANYAAANACLDALVHWRRARGLPGLTVNWGPWAETGGARDARVGGLGKIRPPEAFAALEEALARDDIQTGAVRLGPDHALVFPETRHSSYFARVAAASARDRAADTPFDPGRLRATDPLTLRRTVTERLAERVRPVLGHQEDVLPLGEPLVHLGLDSLAAVRIKNAVRDDFRLDIPVARLLAGVSVSDLAGEITAALTGTADREAAGPAEAGRETAEDRSRARRTRMAQQARRRQR
ncbi:SDR family NAD(P)-dependent oxidoreductase [Streptomyces sp. NPDC003691]